MYNIIDLLDKTIVMKQKAHEMYKSISVMEDIDDKIKVVARILVSQETRHIQACEDLKSQVKENDIPSIDFGIYDQASNLISSFRYPVSGHIKDINQLLNFAIDFENQNLSLLVSIQGLLIRESEDSASVTYDVLSQIIKEVRQHIKNIEKFLQ